MLNVAGFLPIVEIPQIVNEMMPAEEPSQDLSQLNIDLPAHQDDSEMITDDESSIQTSSIDNFAQNSSTKIDTKSLLSKIYDIHTTKNNNQDKVLSELITILVQINLLSVNEIIAIKKDLSSTRKDADRFKYMEQACVCYFIHCKELKYLFLSKHKGVAEKLQLSRFGERCKKHC